MRKVRLLLVLFLILPTALSWYYTSHLYRQPVDLSYPTPTSDVEVLLTISYDSDMRSDFSDLRFTYWDGSTEVPVPFWVEEYTPSTSAKVWVRVPSLGPSTRLYMYYGSSSATSQSDGSATFFFFDDFSSSTLAPHWNTDPGLSYTLSSGTITMYQQLGMWADLSINIQDGYVSETRSRLLTSSGSYSGVFASPMSDDYTRGGNAGGAATLLYMVASGSTTNLDHYFGNGCANSYNIHASGLGSPLSLSTYYIFSLAVVPRGGSWDIYVYKDRNVIHTDTTSTWCKNLDKIRLGFFSRSSTASTKSVEYDWVLVRKYYDPTTLTTTFLAEEVANYVLLNITSPSDGDFVSSPFSVSIDASTNSVADVSLYIDGTLLTTWTINNNTTLTYTITTSPGSHNITVRGNTSLSSSEDSINIVVLSSSSGSGGGSSVCYRCIAEAVWEYEERRLTENQSSELLQDLSTLFSDYHNNTTEELLRLHTLLQQMREEYSTKEDVDELSQEVKAFYNTSREEREALKKALLKELYTVEGKLDKLLLSLKAEEDKRQAFMDYMAEKEGERELRENLIIILQILIIALAFYIGRQRKRRWGH